MVIQCIEQLLKAQAGNIKSGWKNIFGVFHLAASINDERILRNSFDVTSEVVRHMTDKYFHSMLDSFQDAVKCLSEFACNSSSPDISIEAIGLIRHFAVFVAERPDVFAEQQHPLDETVIKSIPESDLVWMKGWFPILFELSCIINRCKLDVRTRFLSRCFLVS
jgi:brefeldin A-inhibited guanine nucleotide-exchange protein